MQACRTRDEARGPNLAGRRPPLRLAGAAEGGKDEARRAPGGRSSRPYPHAMDGPRLHGSAIALVGLSAALCVLFAADLRALAQELWDVPPASTPEAGRSRESEAFRLAMPGLYFACLHSHTGFSDGTATPLEALEHVWSETEDVHVFALTDHARWTSDQEWETTLDLIAAYEARWLGVLLPIAGFEWTSDEQGHVNVFGTHDRRVDALSHPNWDSFAAWLRDQSDAVGQINHPDWSFYNASTEEYRADVEGWWRERYDPQVDAIISLAEAINTGTTVPSWGRQKDYFEILDAGWHVSPTANQDNHRATWGTANQLRTGIWAQSLSTTSILDALRQRRTFATEDSSAYVMMYCEQHAMGDVFEHSRTELLFRVIAGDLEQDDRIDSIRLMTDNRVVVASLDGVDSTYCEWVFTVPAADGYYCIEVTQQDANWIVSAPVWPTHVPTTPED